MSIVFYGFPVHRRAIIGIDSRTRCSGKLRDYPTQGVVAQRNHHLCSGQLIPNTTLRFSSARNDGASKVYWPDRYGGTRQLRKRASAPPIRAIEDRWIGGFGGKS